MVSKKFTNLIIFLCSALMPLVSSADSLTIRFLKPEPAKLITATEGRDPVTHSFMNPCASGGAAIYGYNNAAGSTAATSISPDSPSYGFNSKLLWTISNVQDCLSANQQQILTAVSTDDYNAGTVTFDAGPTQLSFTTSGQFSGPNSFYYGGSPTPYTFLKCDSYTPNSNDVVCCFSTDETCDQF